MLYFNPHPILIDISTSFHPHPFSHPPVTHLHGLGVHGHDEPEVLRHPVQQEARHPQVVTHLDALAGANLRG